MTIGTGKGTLIPPNKTPEDYLNAANLLLASYKLTGNLDHVTEAIAALQQLLSLEKCRGNH